MVLSFFEGKPTPTNGKPKENQYFREGFPRRTHPDENFFDLVAKPEPPHKINVHFMQMSC